MSPTVHIYMDASDTGLCALDPARNEYIRCRFSEHDRKVITPGDYAYSINVRELQSAVLATLHWGAAWQNRSSGAPTVVGFHIDNTSAVAWTNRRRSRHPLAQTFLRLLSVAEFQFNLILTAEHIQGESNTMADAGSLAWEPSHPLWSLWTDMSREWSQVVTQPLYTDLSAAWDACCTGTLWPTLPTSNTKHIGSNGSNSTG